jgi:hypothetical protein
MTDKNRNLRSFGITMAGAFSGLALLAVWRHHPTFAIAFAGLAIVFLVLLFAAPRLLALIERVWMRFARVLGAINTRIFVTLFYFLVVVPGGLIMRLLRRNQLNRIAWGRSSPKSSWVDYPARQHDPRHYEQMF